MGFRGDDRVRPRGASGMVRGSITRNSIALTSLALGVLLTGCTGSPAPSHTPTASPSATSAPTPTPTADPVFQPTGTASANHAYFDFVNKKVFAANPKAGGRDFIDALVTAGFDKASMQVTVDTTTVDLQANSIQFSVKINDGCLIGQYGQDSDGYHSEVAPVLSTGACLVGQTRPIDW